MTNNTKHNNLIQGRYNAITTVWVVDETLLGTVAVFIVLNLRSGCVVGYIINMRSENLNGEQLECLLRSTIEGIIQDEGELPRIFHGDKAPVYQFQPIQECLAEHNIEFSTSAGGQHGNQVSESFNNSLKTVVARKILENTTTGERKVVCQHLSKKERKLNTTAKTRNSGVRKKLFASEWFNKNAMDIITEAVVELNEMPHKTFTSFSRLQVEYFIQRIIKQPTEAVVLKSNSPEALQHQLVESSDLKTMNNKIVRILQLPKDQQPKKFEELYSESEQYSGQFKMLGQTMVTGFKTIYASNEKLMSKVDALKEELDKANQELNFLKQAREERERRKEAQQQKKLREKVEPLMLKHYEWLIASIPSTLNFENARLRLALSVLFITGMRVGELRNVEFKDINTIFDNQRPFVKIQTMKRGKPRTANLSKQGRKIAKERKTDYEFLLKEQGGNLELPIFAREKDQVKVSREFLTKRINRKLASLQKQFNGRFTSHSFRHGFITHLWEKTSDVVFVQQQIGHSKIETTNLYIQNMSNEELAERMKHID